MAHSRKDDPWHSLALVILCDVVCRQNTGKELEERGVYLEDGEEEEQRDSDAV